MSEVPAAVNWSAKTLYRRHTWPVRVMHWVNVVALVILLMSGLQIFNAHPSLTWGKSSYNGHAPILEIGAEQGDGGRPIGVTRVFGAPLHTTGVLGLSRDASGDMAQRAFPSWITLPGSQWLAMARRWHFFFAWVFVINGLFYVTYAIISRHLSRDLAPTHQDWTSIGQSIRDHVRFRHPQGEAARRYNILQKITYLAVIFGLLPFAILMGLAMSPRLDSMIPGWVDVVGGRQSARTLHFLSAGTIVLFVLVHVFEVVISGLWNNMRSMLTGQYAIRSEMKPVAGSSLPDAPDNHA